MTPSRTGGTYDVIVVGAGPAGLFASHYLSRTARLKGLLLDKGKQAANRSCPMGATGECLRCRPCNILSGVGGAGLYSDGKLNFIHVLGKTDLDLYPAENAHKYRNDDRYVMETNQVWEDVEENYGSDNQKRYVHVLKAPARDAHSQVIGIQGMFWDVTERVRAQQEFDRLFAVSLDMMCVAGIDGYFKRVNPAWLVTF